MTQRIPASEGKVRENYAVALVQGWECWRIYDTLNY